MRKREAEDRARQEEERRQQEEERTRREAEEKVMVFWGQQEFLVLTGLSSLVAAQF